MKTKFNRWFRARRFRNFSPDEFTSYFTVHRRRVTNSYPPERLWKNIIPTLRIVDAMRDHFGRACVISSSYRSPDYNRAIGKGASSVSQHIQFTALDIAVAGHTPREVYTLLLQWRREGRWKGGLGLYNTFVHIDTRGYNATWGG